MKDRFCTLLSQQVTELQKKLKNDSSDRGTTVGDADVSTSTSGHPISEVNWCVDIYVTVCVCVLGGGGGGGGGGEVGEGAEVGGNSVPGRERGSSRIHTGSLTQTC